MKLTLLIVSMCHHHPISIYKYTKAKKKVYVCIHLSVATSTAAKNVGHENVTSTMELRLENKSRAHWANGEISALFFDCHDKS